MQTFLTKSAIPSGIKKKGMRRESLKRTTNNYKLFSNWERAGFYAIGNIK